MGVGDRKGCPLSSETQLAVAAADVVIAVHSASRPIARAVSSVLDHNTSPVRVIVVAHNIDLAAIANQLTRYDADPRLNVVGLRDDVHSPAGPMNYGFDLATAPYVALLGSDDTFEPGAVDAWLAAAAMPDGPADMVIAPTRDSEGTFHPSPPVRPRSYRGGSFRWLDPVLDRLAFRSAPLGLVNRETFPSLRFTEGLQTGEDQLFSATLWYQPGARIVYPASAPAYREHDDQEDRVTFIDRPVEEEFRASETLFCPQKPWMLDERKRLSLLVKYVRVHFFDGAQARLSRWTPDTAKAMAAVGRRIELAEPRVTRLLSRADAALFRALLDPRTPAARLEQLLVARSKIRSLAALLPYKLRYVLHSQAPLRTHLAGAILLRAMNRKRASG